MSSDLLRVVEHALQQGEFVIAAFFPEQRRVDLPRSGWTLPLVHVVDEVVFFAIDLHPFDDMFVEAVAHFPHQGDELSDLGARAGRLEEMCVEQGQQVLVADPGNVRFTLLVQPYAQRVL